MALSKKKKKKISQFQWNSLLVDLWAGEGETQLS